MQFDNRFYNRGLPKGADPSLIYNTRNTPEVNEMILKNRRTGNVHGLGFAAAAANPSVNTNVADPLAVLQISKASNSENASYTKPFLSNDIGRGVQRVYPNPIGQTGYWKQMADGFNK
jgi:hypothetical protein